LAIALSSCNAPEAFRPLSQGVEWRLLAFGNEGTARDSVQWLRIDALIKPIGSGDTLASFKSQIFEISADSLWDFLSTRAVNDSLLLRLSHATFLYPSLGKGDTLEAFVALRMLRTAAQLRDARLNEFQLLDTLLRRDSVVAQYKEMDGLWLRTLREGTDTSAIVKGKEISIHYTGWHLDGRVFDNSRTGEGAFRFVYGNEGQVIEGIDLALKHMHRGEESEMILPSWLAFGKKGSADGRVAPYTPVVYRVEVIEVAKD
jgi:FKBP-type peptidyl-prolyl cis-trans isomerase